MGEHLRLAALHDISGFGRGSMTTAIAVSSAAGVQCCPVVGSVLSAHTAYPQVTVRDLTEDLPGYIDSWQRIGCDFDALYSGYMSHVSQGEQMLRLLEKSARPGCLFLVDPVMGDNGKAYAGSFGAEFARQMRDYCAHAHIVTPNLTEAAMLLGKEPDAWKREEHPVERYLEGLLEMGCQAAVITGVETGEGRIGARYLTRDGQQGLADCPRVDAYVPGTGDLFASVLLVTLLRRGRDRLEEGVQMAVDFVYRCVEHTHKAGTPPLNGVLLEEMLPILWEKLR